MHTEGITWHAVVLEPKQFAATKTLLTETLGLPLAMDVPNFALFSMPNGTMLELYGPEAVPAYGYNESFAFGFRVDDIEVASHAVEAAGCELLGEIVRIENIGYTYRHFRGPDGRVYGLNEQGTSTDTSA